MKLLSNRCRHLFKTATGGNPVNVSVSNVLAILEHMSPLREPPQFWLQTLALGDETPPNVEGEDVEDDWRTFFDGKLTADISPNPKTNSRRLPIHSALGSHFSHQARISACWTSLIPLLSSPEPSARALAALHAVITPEFRQPFMLMDWVSGCVDHGPTAWMVYRRSLTKSTVGGSVGLLALNVMHHLIVVKNLYVLAWQMERSVVCLTMLFRLQRLSRFLHEALCFH